MPHFYLWSTLLLRQQKKIPFVIVRKKVKLSTLSFIYVKKQAVKTVYKTLVIHSARPIVMQ